jgi:hypothetical protein
MFGKKRNPNALDIPPLAKGNPTAMEVLRV